MRLLAIFLALAACGPVQKGASPAAAEPTFPPRAETQSNAPGGADPGPISPGPMRFDSIARLDFESSPYARTLPILSPDGQAAARWHGGEPAPVEIVPIGPPGRVEVPNRVSFRSFGTLWGAAGSSPDVLAWSSDSRELWSVRQKTAMPSGFALGGLEPIAIGRDGKVRSLPPLRHSAGLLDGLQWVGGKGRALALFGALGAYYRPEHDDREPTLAMVDARRGRILASVPARTLPRLRRRVDAGAFRVTGATATLLADGRIRTVVQFGRWGERVPRPSADPRLVVHPPLWLLWTQGDRPRLRPSPYPDDRFSWPVLVPGGKRLLVLRPLQPDGIQIQCRAAPCPPGPPPRPVTGSIAELLDVESGRVLWRLRTRADRFWSQNAPPAVSGDGRFALIPLPPDDDRLPIALVDMSSGRILQTVAPAPVGSHAYGLGFTEDGRRAWVGTGHRMVFYRFGRT